MQNDMVRKGRNLSLAKTVHWQRALLILLGLFLSTVLLELGLRLGGFVLLSFQEHLNMRSIRQKGSYRILCLGESTTAGQYPVFLEQILNKKNIGISFSVIDKGVPAIDTNFVLSHLEENLNQYNPQMVVVMMGVNERRRSFRNQYNDYMEATFSDSFLTSLKTYKLIVLLWSRLINKTQHCKRETQEKLQLEMVIDGRRSASQAVIIDRTGPEDAFREMLKRNPRDDDAYVGLGHLFHSTNNFADAEQAFKRAIEINSKNRRAYAYLIWLYDDNGHWLDAEKTFQESLVIDPKNNEVYHWMGIGYLRRLEYVLAEKAFEKAIELNPGDGYSYLELCAIYRQQHKYSQIEGLFQKAYQQNNYFLCGGLALVLDKYDLAEEYFRKAKAAEGEFDYTPQGKANFLRIKDILDARRIILVCVQYPMCNLQPLKEIFQGQKNIIFVDNEKVFKKTLRKGSYNEYFEDNFAVNFGHCTDKGNRLLAENIADTILWDYFHK